MGPAVIFTSFLAAFAQIWDGRFLRVLLTGLALSVALLVGVYALFLLGIAALTPDQVTVPFLGPVDGLHQLLGWASLLFMMGLSIFLMVPAAAAFAGLFTDEVAQAVEDRHYSWLPPVRPQGWGETLKASVNLIGLIVLVNVVLLLLLPFTAGFAVPVWYLANGFLLGREYFTMVALRRMEPEAVRAMRRRNGMTVWIAGTLMALPLSVPLVNLLVPVVGTATFTHIFHRLAAAGR